MNCSCSIDSGVDDFAEMLSRSFHIARKEHVCGECGEQIQKGENYLREKVLFDGSISEHKTCLVCENLRSRLLCSFYWGEVLETIKEGVWENDGEIPEDCISRLIPKAREWICGVLQQVYDHFNELDADAA